MERNKQKHNPKEHNGVKKEEYNLISKSLIEVFKLTKRSLNTIKVNPGLVTVSNFLNILLKTNQQDL